MQISYLRSWLILLIFQQPSAPKMAKNVTSGIIKQVLGRESSSLKVVTTNVDQRNVGGRGVGGGFQYCPF